MQKKPIQTSKIKYQLHYLLKRIFLNILKRSLKKVLISSDLKKKDHFEKKFKKEVSI